MLHILKRKKGALATTGGGVLILFALLAFLFAGCDLDGDSEEISGVDSGNTSGDTSVDEGDGSSSGDTSVDEDDDSDGSSDAEIETDHFDDATSTYHVYTLEGLQDWASNYSTYSCTLYGDITLSDEWTPIGTDSTPYTATFDGGGYTISNLKIESSDNYAGFFGYIGSEGKVANLTLKSPSVSGEDAVNYVGAIAGYNDGGSIEGCTVSGGEVSGNRYVGGVAGYSTGTVSGCSNSGTVKSTVTSGLFSDTGGIVGNSSGTVSNCSNSGRVTSTGFYTGGVAGYSSGTVSNCSNSGNVSSEKAYVGGIVGENDTDSTVEDCTNSGNISGKSNSVGGIAGYNYTRGTVSGCNNSGKVSSDGDYIGGIVGGNWVYATVTTCENSGSVSGNDRVGGIVGYNEATVTSCDNSGTVSGNDNVGAVVGYNSSFNNTGTVSGCKWLSGTASSGIGGGTDVDTEEYS